MKTRGRIENLTSMGKGRPKGVPNRVTQAVKEAIIEAFDKAGGVEYLVGIARNDPRTFCALLGRVLPLELTGANGGPVEIKTIEVTFVKPDDKR